MTMIVGLTGLIGSGKTLASEIFREQGFCIIDTDEISRELSAGKAQSIIYNEFGTVNRAELRSIVLEETQKLKQLENILHPLIFEEVKKHISSAENKYIMLVVPLLFKSPKYLELIDKSLLIDADLNVIKERLQHRGLSAQEIERLIQQQLPIEIQRQYADDIITNNSSRNDFIKKIIIQNQKYMQSEDGEHR